MAAEIVTIGVGCMFEIADEGTKLPAGRCAVRAILAGDGRTSQAWMPFSREAVSDAMAEYYAGSTPEHRREVSRETKRIMAVLMHLAHEAFTHSAEQLAVDSDYAGEFGMFGITADDAGRIIMLEPAEV